MAKEVSFAKPRPRPDPAALDDFVTGGRAGEGAQPAPEPPPVVRQPEPPAARVPMKRLTFDIPADLHMRMKLDCVSNGKDMAEELRAMIDARWPANP
jgi:hypothetical protein